MLFNERDRKRWCDLAGVSTEIIASVGGAVGRKRKEFRENMLITHRGISGPAILQISSYWDRKESLIIDFVPDRSLSTDISKRGHRDHGTWKTKLREVLPRRFADRWVEMYPLAGNSDRDFAAAEQDVRNWKVVPEATEGYGKAEVTAGGVDTQELSAKTMESRKVPGLFFIGEVVDVTGQLGGFNFQWAWASGFCAGQAV